MSGLTCQNIEHAYKEWISALDSFEDAIFLHDKDFRILRCNKAYQKYAQLPYEKMIGHKYFEVFPKIGAPLSSCLKGLEQPGSHAHEEVVEIGNLVFRSFSYSIVDNEGKYLHSMHVMQDITKYKRIEIELLKSEEKFRTLIESVSDWMWEVDKQALYTYVGPQSKTILGYEPEELLGKSPFAFMPSREAQRLQLVFKKIVEAESEIVTLENIMLHKDGHEITLETSGIPFFDDAGKLLGYRGVDRDITDRKEAEIALHRANRALKTLSAGNLALVKALNEDELLHTVTNVIVNKGGYSLATVVYSKDDIEKSMVIKAWSGADENYFYSGYLSWNDTPEGQLPSARAIRNGTSQVCKEIENSSGYQPWKDACLAHNFASNIAFPLLENGKAFGALSIYSYQNDSFDEEEIELLEELANDLAYGIINLRTRARHEQHSTLLRESLEQSIQAIAATLESRDPYTAGHQRRVSELAVAIAEEMGLSDEQIKGISFAAIVHDLGKIHVPAEILSKPTRLNELEYKLIQMHPQTGYDILKDINFPWPIADIILQHHEKIDGTGYPQGLKGDEILLESKIVALADVVEAMSSHRPYRASLGIETALDEIKRGRGLIYDSSVVDACLKIIVEKDFKFSSDF